MEDEQARDTDATAQSLLREIDRLAAARAERAAAAEEARRRQQGNSERAGAH